MLLLQAFILWLMVSTLVIGGAIAFLHFFPQESPWFGFFVPPLAFVILVNFIEHFVAIPSLLAFLPLLLGFLIWILATSKIPKESLLLPSLIFLGSFAFTFGVRCIQPDILYTSDGLADLNKINNYCQGDILPPTDTWLPPFRYEWYYSLQHYAASLIKRLLNIKLGMAYNISHALLSAFICVAGAAATHRISSGKLWITIATPFLIESAATGSFAYLQLTMKDFNPWVADNLSGATPDNNPIWKLLAIGSHQERLELQPPGWWTWREEYHANAAGHFLTLLSVFIIAELSCWKKAIWPWVMAGLIPIYAVIASTWAFPITFLLCGGAAAIALFCNRRPAQIGITLTILFASLILLWPAFYDVTASPEIPSIRRTATTELAPFCEFVIQWWPILLLWISGCVCFRQLSFGVRWIMIVVPIMLIGIECITIEGRYNTVEKMWGYTYGVAFIALFPIVALRTAMAYRIVTLTLLVSCLISLCGRTYWILRWASTDDIFHLEGNHYITADEQKMKMLHALAQIKHATFLTGKSIAFNYYESPALTVFTENRSYSTWTYFESVANYVDVAEYREKQNNDFYSGNMPNRLQFLRSNDITGVVIWPENDIPNDFLDTLSKELDPFYQYIDCRGNGEKNAGVFLLRSAPLK